VHDNPVVRVYDVHDLVYRDELRGPGKADFDSVIDLIACCVKPTAWEPGSSPIAPCHVEGIDVLVLAQAWEVHREVDVLLSALRAVRHASPPKPGEAPVAPVLLPWEKAIRQALARRHDFNLRDASLSDVVDELRRVFGVKVDVDFHAIKEGSLGANPIFDFHGYGITGEKALDAMLDPEELTWTMRYEMLLITTPDDALMHLRPRVYDVAGLVPPGKEMDFDWLIDRIAKQVGRDSWDPKSGPGTIQLFQSKGIRALVVCQTERIQRRVEALLIDLQKKPPPELIRKPAPKGPEQRSSQMQSSDLAERTIALRARPAKRDRSRSE